jgi:DNA-binding MarR family transcriptional regulator
MMKKTKLVQAIIELQRMVDRTRRQYELDIWMSLRLSIAQLKSLFFICNQGSTNMSALAAALRVTPTNTTGIVDRLVKQGFVSRSENALDRRMQSLRTTPKGEDLVEKLRERRRGFMSDLLGRMSASDLSALAKGFTALAEVMEAHEGKRNNGRETVE